MHERLEEPRLEIDAGRCVHGGFPFATCRKCVEICPAEALILSDRGLSIDVAACTACGRCRGACPQSAIDIVVSGGSTLASFPVIDRETSTAYLACQSVAGRANSRGSVLCLDALRESEISALATAGVRRLVVCRDRCPYCGGAEGAHFRQMLDRLHRLRGSRDEPDLLLLDVGVPAWLGARDAVVRQRTDLDQHKRRLFGAMRLRSAGRGEIRRQTTPGKASAERLYRYVPCIAGERCTGCDACARVCPSGAITVALSDGLPAYRLSAEACTGCGLCVDVCEDGAVAVTEVAPVIAKSVPLREAKCRSCGAAFREPEQTAGPPSQLCRICRRCDHQKRLFQRHDLRDA